MFIKKNCFIEGGFNNFSIIMNKNYHNNIFKSLYYLDYYTNNTNNIFRFFKGTKFRHLKPNHL